MQLNHAAPPESANAQIVPDLTSSADLCHLQLFLSRANYTGDGFLCIGDSHRFIDPIFAYGVYFGIQEGEFGDEAIARHLSGEVKSNGKLSKLS